jgi:hypothetical protein
MRRLAVVPFLIILTFTSAGAQEAGKTLAATMDVYACPQDGQAADVQSKDEAACYEWAASNTGSDPFELQKQSEQQEQQTEQQVAQAQASTKGAGAAGAVKGAAAGALIGEISHGDTSQSAAWGAAAGLVASRRHAHRASAEAQQQATSQGASQQQATEEQIDNFKKAFSACLEAKKYLVKY